MENTKPFIHSFENCSLSFAFSAVNGKWKPYIIWYLSEAPGGVCRYGELKRRVPYKISHKIFTQQLQELERDNIILRTEYDEKPLRVEYTLTEAGWLLVPVVYFMRDWGAIANPKFTQRDLLERTKGELNGEYLNYYYRSEKIDKEVSIKFKY